MMAAIDSSHASQRVRFATGPFRLVESEYSPGAQLAPHAHDHSNISLVLSGSIGEGSESGVVTAGAGCAVFKPAGTVHQNSVGPEGVRIFALRLDPTWEQVRARLDAYYWCSQAEIVRSLLLLYALIQAADAVPRSAMEKRVWRWWQSAWTLGRERHRSFQRTPLWLIRVQERIHAGGEAVGGIRSLSREVGSHPVYLARAFRRHLGTAPAEYARRRKITEAAYRIASTSDSLSRIALELGFSDQAHLCRRFKAQMGLSPGAYRRTARKT